MTPEDILADCHQPTDDDLVRLEETLYPLLLAIPYDSESGKRNLSGIILNDETYKEIYGAPFPLPTEPSAYDTSIPDDAKAVLRARSEAIHKAHINDYLLNDATLRATHRFILGVIDDTYIPTLKTSSRTTTQQLGTQSQVHLARCYSSGKFRLLARPHHNSRIKILLRHNCHNSRS